MTTGITFYTLEDAQDYRKMKRAQGQDVKINRIGKEYKAIITGEIPWTEETAKEFIGSSSYPLLEGEKLPPIQTRRELSKYGIAYDIDPEITDVLLELNKKGYKTVGSCAGHRDEGYIIISSESTEGNKEKIIDILKKHRLKINEIKKDADITTFSFKPVGKILEKKEV